MTRSGSNDVEAPSTLSTGATPRAQVHSLLVSLLHWWPYGPHQQSPSILLCGPTFNGKSHLVRGVVHDANTALCHPQSQSAATTDLVAHECRRRAILVTPQLAAAIAVQNARDGGTGLRRLLRRVVQEACIAELLGMGQRNTSTTTTTDSDARSELSVLLVLDHVECYLTHDEMSVNSGEAADLPSSAARGGGNDAATSSNVMGGLSTQYPGLLADLYTILRSAPPLFTEDECVALHLSTLLYVSLFTGEMEEVQPIIRQRYVDFALSLPTPTEAERRAVFGLYTAASSPEGPATRIAGSLLPPPLAEALVLRTGGVSYGGLQELVALALDDLDDPTDSASGWLCSAAANSPAPELKESVRHTAEAAAQRVLHAYQTSGSVTALKYRRSAGYVDVQVTRWNDIAGMADVKATLRRLVTDPVRHRDTYLRFRVRPSTGVLLYGPPGTGKTMLAKAMATELNASFVYIDLPELLQSEVGESERRLQAYFDVARERSPSLVFMDEVQAAFGLRYGGEATSSHRPLPGSSTTPAAMSTTSHDARLVSHLLRLLDAAQHDDDHFVLFVGATNVVHLLDPLLLRAGRLDTLLEVPLPDAAARECLVRRVICGEWAGWFRQEERTAAPSTTTNSEQLARIQTALVDEFVRLSEGFSGAQVRNFLSVFGLQMARRVGLEERQNTEGVVDMPLLGCGTTSSNDGGALQEVAQEQQQQQQKQKQRHLQEFIARFLAGEGSDEVLSCAALELIRSSYAKSAA
jgi:SpoVK/Ycf46/Vps4 family AAA+-type ATPase